MWKRENKGKHERNAKNVFIIHAEKASKTTHLSISAYQLKDE